MSLRFVAKKVAGAFVLLVLVVVFNFFLFRIVDRDPLAKYRGRTKLTPEQRAEIIERFGLTGSKWEQFVRYIRQTARLDFGRSFDSTRRVSDEIMDRLPNTLALVGTATIITVVLGLWIGARAGWRRGSSFDSASTSATMVLYATPEFFLGMLLLAFVGGRLGWFPTGGVRDVAADHSGVAALVDRTRHLVLPVLTLTLAYLGSYTLIMRTSILDTLGEEYLRTARAKGVRDSDILKHHSFPNALLPVVSLIAISFGFIIGGAITVETVFSYPGLGLATADAIDNNDLPMLQALFMFSSAAVIVCNLVADLLLGVLDPRIRRAE
jgi:peptide/nickel transport system permease protein